MSVQQRKFVMPESPKGLDRQLWQNYSQAILYNDPDSLPARSITPDSESPESGSSQ